MTEVDLVQYFIVLLIEANGLKDNKLVWSSISIPSKYPIYHIKIYFMEVCFFEFKLSQTHINIIKVMLVSENSNSNVKAVLIGELFKKI